jgi:hypothetical protein
MTPRPLPTRGPFLSEHPRYGMPQPAFWRARLFTGGRKATPLGHRASDIAQATEYGGVPKGSSRYPQYHRYDDCQGCLAAPRTTRDASETGRNRGLSVLARRDVRRCRQFETPRLTSNTRSYSKMMVVAVWASHAVGR